MTVIQVSKAEAAARLGVSERTITRRIVAGKLQTIPDANGGRQTLVVLDFDSQKGTAPTIDGQNGTAATERFRVLETMEQWNEELRSQLRASQDREGALIDALRQIALPAPRSRSWWKVWGAR